MQDCLQQGMKKDLLDIPPPDHVFKAGAAENKQTS